MRRVLRHAFIITVSIATPVSAQAPAPGRLAPPSPYIDAAQGVSLDEAIARALKQEPTLAASRYAVGIARGQRVQAGLRPNPTVSFERREDPGGTDNQTMAGVQWPLDLFRRAGRIGVAEREITAAEFDVRDQERMIAAEVRSAYGTLLRAVRELSILDELVGAITRQHELVSARVNEGAAPPLERDLLSVELQRLRSERVLQVGRADTALFALKRAIGMPPEVPLKVREDLESAMRGEPAVAIDAGGIRERIAQRGDVRAAEARVDVAEAGIDRARRDGRFDLSVTGSYMRMDAGFPQLGFRADRSLERVRGMFHYFSGGVMVMTPLFNRNQGEIAAARAERARSAQVLEATRVAAANELAAAMAQDAQARAAVEVFTGGALALARRNLDVVMETFTVGRATVFDVLAEQRRYLELERADTDALGAAFDARTALQRALGEVQ